DSVDALQRAVAAAPRVRCVGSRHSILDRIVPPPGGTLIDVRGMTRIELPPAPPSGPGDVSTVTAEAGVRLDVLSDALAGRGWALSTLPAQATVTVAGAIALGSHNTASRSPAVLADEVEALEGVDATGELVRFSPEDLPAARIGLGAIGAVSRVTLRVVPAADVRHAAVERDADEVFSDLFALSGHLHLWLTWKLLPGGRERVVVRTIDPLPAGAGLPHQAGIAQVPRPAQWAAKGLAALAARFEAAKPLLIGAIGPMSPRAVATRHAFCEHLDWMYGTDASIAIPAESVPAARIAVREAFRDAGYQPHLPILIRFLPASDRTLLGLNAGRAVAVFEVLSLAGFTDFPAGRKAFCDALAPFSPRAHWAKGALGHVRSEFPAESWRRWEAVRARVDPLQKFLAPGLAPHLGG
ncbi:MAG: FAD-binding protein, partial [Myxococcota bacterium]